MAVKKVNLEVRIIQQYVLTKINKVDYWLVYREVPNAYLSTKPLLKNIIYI